MSFLNSYKNIISNLASLKNKNLHMKNNLFNLSIVSLSLVAILSISCSKSNQQADVLAKDSATVEATSPVSAPASNNVEVAKNNASQALLPTTNNAPVASAVAAPQSGAGLNPAHGQPGHRCDIPVGAPLNSPAPSAQPANAAPQVQMNPVQAPVSAPQQTVTAPGMNPPHGEPGHRCEIPVGAPLNS